MKVKQLSCVCVCARAVLAIYISAVILLLQCENEKLNEILAEAEILRSFFVYMWCKEKSVFSASLSVWERQ